VKKLIKIQCYAGHQWLTPIILATQETEIRSIAVGSQPGQIVCETLSQKHHHKKGLLEWLKVKALSSSPSTTKKKSYFSGFCDICANLSSCKA
jgi:hypothetical protein